MYEARGLKISQINTDNKFEFIREVMKTIPLNIVTAGDHVGDVERSNRTIKEWTQWYVHCLPYKRYLK